MKAVSTQEEARAIVKNLFAKFLERHDISMEEWLAVSIMDEFDDNLEDCENWNSMFAQQVFDKCPPVTPELNAEFGYEEHNTDAPWVYRDIAEEFESMGMEIQ